MNKQNSELFPLHLQTTQWDCGPACLKMIAGYYGKNFNLHQMKNWNRMTREGSSMIDIMDTAEALGIYCKGLQLDITKLKSIGLPAILHWDKDHFVVLFNIDGSYYFIADPAIGILKLNELDLVSHWQNHESDNQSTGILLIFSDLR